MMVSREERTNSNKQSSKAGTHLLHPKPSRGKYGWSGAPMGRVGRDAVRGQIHILGRFLFLTSLQDSFCHTLGIHVWHWSIFCSIGLVHILFYFIWPWVSSTISVRSHTRNLHRGNFIHKESITRKRWLIKERNSKCQEQPLATGLREDSNLKPTEIKTSMWSM